MSNDSTTNNPVGADNNVSTVDRRASFEVIRLGFVIVGSLAGSALILSAVNGFREIDPATLALVSSSITGIFAFLAGRKK